MRCLTAVLVTTVLLVMGAGARSSTSALERAAGEAAESARARVDITPPLTSKLRFQGAPAEDIADRFVGAFKLVSYVAYDQDGSATPTPYRDGIIMYDATGHMSVHLMHGDRARPEGALTDADRTAMYSSYIAYYGSYEVIVVNGVVEHHVDGSLIPSLVGTTQVRHFEFEDDGDTLILMVKNGDRVQGRLRWERSR
jgi:hypothetical protein